VHNQWRALDRILWGISLFSLFGSSDFFGFVLLGFVFEWPISKLGREIHQFIPRNAKRGAPIQ
jgi:hypothetical protein